MADTAREVMETRFFTLTPQHTLGQAARALAEASEATGRRVFGMMVVDAQGRLVGMLSLYDILLAIRPKHIHLWGEMQDLELEGLLDRTCRQAATLRVGDVMTTDLITVEPDTHLLRVIDLMLKKHVRRLPVVEQGRILGMVYLSRVFEYLLDRLTAALPEGDWEDVDPA